MSNSGSKLEKKYAGNKTMKGEKIFFVMVSVTNIIGPNILNYFNAYF